MRVVAGVAAGLCLVAGSLAAQGGAFIVRVGNDTLLVERYTRAGAVLEGDQVARTTATTFLRHFKATLDRRGNVVRYELIARPADQPQAPPRTLQLRFDADTAEIVFVNGDTSRSERLPVPGGALPIVPHSYAMLELATRQAVASGRPTFGVPLLSLTSFVPIAATLTRGAGDTLALVVGDAAPLYVRVDSAGDILGGSGIGTEAVTLDRVAAVDITSVAREFSNRPLGPLSPADSVQAVIGDAQIRIAYSRPAVRGRKIFGGLVPWNQVWRTGANAATRLTTSAEVVLGSQAIPRGSYTLWTLPSPAGWKLIINRQTTAPCQGGDCARAVRRPLWGTEYTADSDLARVDLRVEPLGHPVERLTITLEAAGRRGVLALAWDTTRAWLPVTAK